MVVEIFKIREIHFIRIPTLVRMVRKRKLEISESPAFELNFLLIKFSERRLLSKTQVTCAFIFSS